MFYHIKNSVMKNFFKINIMAGIAAFAVAMYLLITGEYASLEARQAAEQWLNVIAIGGLLYTAVFWFIDIFTHPRIPFTRT